MMLEKTREGNIIGFVSLDRNLILSAPSPAMLNTPPVSANLKRDPPLRNSTPAPCLQNDDSDRYRYTCVPHPHTDPFHCDTLPPTDPWRIVVFNGPGEPRLPAWSHPLLRGVWTWPRDFL